jgi:hypothetical protein
MKKFVLAVPVGALGIALAIAALTNIQYAAGGGRPRPDMERGVLLSNRPNLQICVATSAQAPSVSAVGLVRAAVHVAERHPNFTAARYNERAWAVIAGCPGVPALLASGQRQAKAGGTFAVPPPTDNPSPFRLFVYVVTLDEIERMFGSSGMRLAAQEVFCDAPRDCAEVSSALYIDETVLRNPLALGAFMTQALGLMPTEHREPIGPKEIR